MQAILPVSRFCRVALLFAILGLTLGGCATLADNNQRSLREVITHLEREGLVISEIQATYYPVVMAEDGCALYIDGAKVEVYRYDVSKPKIRQKVEKIAATGKITICGIDFPAVVNGSFVMLTYSQHERVPDIVAAFRRF